MNRNRSVSAHSPNYIRRRVVGSFTAVALAVCALYGGFFAVCALFLAYGWAA